jgi:hypothetical protein
MPEAEVDVLGTEKMPYDPKDPTHKAIIDAYEVIKAAEPKLKKDTKPATLGDVLDAVKELATQVGTLAKEQREMKERHDKWIKAGKF